MNHFNREHPVISILNMELDMFLSVKSDNIYTCQQALD